MTDFKELREALNRLAQATTFGSKTARDHFEKDIKAIGGALDRLEAAERDARRPYIRAELPPLPEWALRDDLGGLVPSEIRAAMRVYARAAVTSHEAAIDAAMKEPKT